MEMGYLTVLHVRLGAKIGNLHAKDSHSFRNEQILVWLARWGGSAPGQLRYKLSTTVVM